MTEVDRRTVLKAGVLAALSSSFATFLGPGRAAAATDPAVVGAWGAPFDMGGIAIHATMTHVGYVLFFQYVEGTAGVDHTAYVGTWNYTDGATGQAPLTYARDLFCAANNVMADGRLFVAGGHDHNTGKKQDPVGVADTDTFTPETRTWTPGPDLSQARWYPTSLTLGNNRSLVFGGQANAGTASNTVDEYDPVANTVTRLPVTATKPVGLYPRMHLLPNGKILKSGPARASAYFSRSTSSWANGPSMLIGSRTRGNSILLPGATRVLTVGGQTNTAGAPTGTAEILDTAAATPKWTSTGSLNNPRILANTINLPDGSVLIIGGGAQFKYTGPVFIPEIWNPATGTWTAMAPQRGSRMYHSTALLLPDGRVLSCGQDNGPLARFGEIFSPPYLFKGPRPAISAAPSSAGYGQQITISSPDAAAITSVVLIRVGSVTHQVDTDQRALPLTFARGTGTLTAVTPANADTAPPGYYMLFIVNGTGVPSVAPWLRLG
jgi:hypothetical protein